MWREMEKAGLHIWQGVLFLAFLLLFGSSLEVAAASLMKQDDGLKPYVKEENGSREMSGIRVTLKTDKDSYSKNDTATLSMEVENTNDYEVTDVKVQYSLPGNFKKESGSTLENIEKLAAGEKKTLELKATVTEDTGAPLSEGAFTLYVVLGVVGGVVILFVIVLLLVMKGKKKKVLSIFMVLTLLAASVPNQAKAAVTTETGNYTMDGKQVFSRVSVHDPSIVKDPKSGLYYIFGSHRAFAKSDNLMDWEYIGSNLSQDQNTLFKHPWHEWAGTATTSGTLNGMMWAPDVIWNENLNK